MHVHGFWTGFLLGCFGGALAETAKWYRIRESHRLPRYARTFKYWIVTVAMIGCGGILATLYGTDDISGILCVNVGASAPLIVASLAGILPSTNDLATRSSGVGEEPSVADLLAGR
jgi:hypothetical protein